MTTFDLFRNLFDRCLNAIFFFDEELTRCVAANLRAERMTGYTLSELRKRGLKDLCAPERFDLTYRIIRRANRQYYDSKGHTLLLDRSQEKKEAAFSCGVFNFGRKNFVKMEFQDLPMGENRARQVPLVAEAGAASFKKEEFFKAFQLGFSQAAKNRSVLSMVSCRVRAMEAPLPSEEENALLDQVEKVLRKNIRTTDVLARLSSDQFMILLTQTPKEKAERLVLRLIAQLSLLPIFKDRTYDFEMEAGYCPPEAYPLMNLLQQAGAPDTAHSRHPH